MSDIKQDKPQEDNTGSFPSPEMIGGESVTNGNQAAQENEKCQNKIKTRNKKLFGKSFREYLLIAINATLAVVTYFLYEAAVDQSESAKDSAKAAAESVIVAKEQFRVSNRPYFVLADVDEFRFAEGESLTTRVHLKNVGNTPAFDVSVIASIESFADSFPDQPIYNKITKNQSRGIIAQQDTAFVPVSTATKMNLAIMSELLTGKVTLYVHGIIKYKDIFKDSHETTFCGRFNPRRNEFVFCDKYNADKE